MTAEILFETDEQFPYSGGSTKELSCKSPVPPAISGSQNTAKLVPFFQFGTPEFQLNSRHPFRHKCSGVV
jgi:hypothetical protein